MSFGPWRCPPRASASVAVADKFDEDLFKVRVVPVSMSGVDAERRLELAAVRRPAHGKHLRVG